MILTGEVLAPGHAGYDQSARTMFAAGTPDLVVRPRVAAEVAAARPGGDGDQPDAHHDTGPSAVR